MSASATTLEESAPGGPSTGDPLLVVKDLKVHFPSADGVVKAVDGLSYTVERGKTLGIVGESGSGKSVSSSAIMGLFHGSTAQLSGQIILDGTDILTLSENEMRKLRGRDVAMIFQDPLSALHPYYTVGAQIVEAYQVHADVSKKLARRRAIELLDRVGIPQPDRRVDDYPHQFSGGMRQRVMIAMALACNPRLLIADEPTTALDVTIQAQILKLMLELKERTGAAVILITHDLGVVAETCQRVIVMYAGRKIEEAPILELFDRPAHPYTRGLMASIPRYGGGRARKRRLAEIPGIVPSLREPIQGCAFAPRCPYAAERCRVEAPPLRQVGGGRVAACHFAEEVMAEGVLAAASPGGRGRVGDSRPGEGLRSLG
ncbi:MAG: ABC transporter ATP-binding protein [Microvirga sp.]